MFGPTFLDDYSESTSQRGFPIQSNISDLAVEDVVDDIEHLVEGLGCLGLSVVGKTIWKRCFLQ